MDINLGGETSAKVRRQLGLQKMICMGLVHLRDVSSVVAPECMPFIGTSCCCTGGEIAYDSLEAEIAAKPWFS